jgi:hypothetical protein
MKRRTACTILFYVLAITAMCIPASAQGGWRQWKVYLLDGTSVTASPLQLRSDGRFTRSMDPNEAGFDRSQIDYLAVNTQTPPPPPTGKVKQDVIVMLDGTRTTGKVTFKSLKFSEGIIVQNGKEMSLENVAYIKFARLKKAK